MQRPLFVGLSASVQVPDSLVTSVVEEVMCVLGTTQSLLGQHPNRALHSQIIPYSGCALTQIDEVSKFPQSLNTSGVKTFTKSKTFFYQFSQFYTKFLSYEISLLLPVIGLGSLTT